MLKTLSASFHAFRFMLTFGSGQTGATDFWPSTSATRQSSRGRSSASTRPTRSHAKLASPPPKTVLRADKDAGNVQLDSETQLTGVPSEAWTYRLGNRSALEWILDQYKEKTPKEPTIREKFNTYRFADHKEKVIDLLKRVTRVSVETMKIVDAMRSEKH
jgi:hypothetical protein